MTEPAPIMPFSKTPAGPECNICGAADMYQRGVQAICASCRSDARTRLMWLLMTSRDLLQSGMRVLHFAPEYATAQRIAAIVGDGYEAVDYDPSGFPMMPGIRKFDLTVDAAALPASHYDIILHSHVMEHVRCNATAVLFHLHRALKSNGKQVCCIPVARDRHYCENLAELDAAEATSLFGQSDHVRLFGALDIQSTLGMIFRIPAQYDLLREFDEATLDRYAIGQNMRVGWSPSSVLILEKGDLLLR